MRIKGSDILLILVAIVAPPLAVFFMTGCSCDLLINILLTILGVIPGHIHAFWLIYRKIKAENTYGAGGYTYVGSGAYQPIYGNKPAAAPATYGSTTTGPVM
ncbi:hypothetical protein FRB99_006244 [Tulasnella sp. 403]|nr:hypothetical protein FRB99_006244 [Tulasnella sp. 403]